VIAALGFGVENVTQSREDAKE